MTDIDDLIQYCKEPISRQYIEEAIRAYKSGAYRSSIISTWLAIVMNLNSKIEQLAIIGELEAIALKKTLDKIKTTNDISGLLAYERDLLKNVKDKFELFDDIVLIDLERIREDRNRCAHPLLHSDDLPYSPTPEQARNHLSIAVEKLISEQNVFGKAALVKIFELIKSPVFPMQYKDVRTVLDGSYLKSPKNSLLRNLIIALFKDSLEIPITVRSLYCNINTLKYICEKFRIIFEKTLLEKSNDIFDFTDQNHLFVLTKLLSIDKLVFDSISQDKRILINEYITTLPEDRLDDIGDILEIDPLKEYALKRIEKIDRNEAKNLVLFFTPEPVVDRLIELYITSPNFSTANEFANILSRYVIDMNERQIQFLLDNIMNNGQVKESNNLAALLRVIKKEARIDSNQLSHILQRNELE